MKKRMAWRYTCEHCGKSGAAGGHISRHEKFCTKNPARDCRMCRMVGNEPVPMATLLASVKVVDVTPVGAADFLGSEPTPFPSEVKIDLIETRKLCGDCPACLLAVVRQFKMPDEHKDSYYAHPFSWEDERKRWMDDYNECQLMRYPSGDQHFEREAWDELRESRSTATTA